MFKIKIVKSKLGEANKLELDEKRCKNDPLYLDINLSDFVSILA